MRIMTTHSTSARVISPTWGWTLGMLTSRLVLFGAFQAVIAVIYALQGSASPWEHSIAWWPITATLTNLASILLLRWRFHHEGMRYRDLLRLEKRTLGQDSLLVLGLLLASGVLAIVPNLGLATLLWGDAERGLELFIRPLPYWAALAAVVLFPISIGLAELPTYYGYVLPRLKALSGSLWLAIGLSALFLSLQHMTLPLIFDASFLVWRALMFLPFALVLAGVLAWRPRLLPYLMMAHVLIDVTVALQVYQASIP